MTVPPALQASRHFMRHFFGEYYAKKPSYDVPEVARREWMWHPFEGTVYRHFAIHDAGELAARLANRPPMHVYHSLASYMHPEVHDMQEKHRGRLRWEVLIDIDVKPDPALGRTNLAEALDHARRQFLSTLQILERDLGLRDYAASFSGSKGYHCRLDREDLQQLSVGARRELGRLLGGHGTELRDVFPSLDPRTPLFPTTVPEGGLRRRLYLAMMRIRSMTDTDSRGLLLPLCERHKPALSDAGDVLARIQATNPNEILADPANSGIAQTWFQVARELACPSVDQSAIADASRMVRLRGSLNGRTGLLCKPIGGIDAVEAFDPLLDANPHPADIKVNATGHRDGRIELGGQPFEVHAGQTARLPVNAAMLFVATGQASPDWPPGVAA